MYASVTESGNVAIFHSLPEQEESEMPAKDDSDEEIQVSIRPPFAVREGLSNLVQQPITNILLLLLTIFVMGSFGYYVAYVEPANRKESQEHTAQLVKQFTDTTEVLSATHAKNIEKIQTEHTTQVKTVVEGHNAEVKDMMGHAERAARGKEELLRELMGKPVPHKHEAKDDDRGAALESSLPPGIG